MATKLDGALRREVTIGGAPYTMTIDPQGLKLVPKGKRKGYELAWDAFVSGEAALATALNASIAAAPQPPGAREKETKPASASASPGAPKQAPATSASVREPQQPPAASAPAAKTKAPKSARPRRG